MFVRQMSYLVALDRQKHFGRAAQECHVTQSTLSAGIKSLERELGMRLVIRKPRFAGLTPEGERVATWARQIIVDYKSLKQDVETFREGLKGTLRLGVIPAALALVANLTSLFATEHPDVAINIESMSSADIQSGIDKFEIDAGITYLDNEPLSGVRRAPLYRERYLFVTNKAGPLGNLSSIAWSEAANENLCLLHEGMQNRRVLDNLARTIGIELAPSVTTNSFLAICSHVSSGGWSSIIPHTFGYIFLGSQELVLVELTDPVHTQTIGLVVTSRDPLPPLAQAVASCARRLKLDNVVGARTLVLT